MAIVEKTRTWDDNWNNVIRYVIFQNDALKKQMQVPEKTSIMKFQTDYFIQDAATDQLLTDELVRVTYCDLQGTSLGTLYMRQKYKAFDIYVKKTCQFDATNDRLKDRCKLIAERLNYILRGQTYICNLRFEYEDEYDMWTKMVGYKRYRIVFSYKISV